MKQSIITICAIVVALAVASTKGTTIPEKPLCIKRIINPDGSHSALTCPAFKIDPKKCHIKPGNPHKPYPGCCDAPVCDGDKPSY
ncbi:hypothetical protein BDF22DRAFT_696371 [Syncephalis plumigaleata]|nr:hypothetical protein BDF22DRAFT_696371 [Syncephalis plumigaleata]